MTAAVVRPLASFTVVVDPDEARAFGIALGLPASPVPPPTFAIRFLFHPAARAALAAFMPDNGTLPIHVGQRFRHHRPLRPGETLSCALGVAPAEGGRPFTLVRLELTTPAGEAVCQAESEIAMVAPGFTWTQRGEAR